MITEIQVIEIIQKIIIKEALSKCYVLIKEYLKTINRNLTSKEDEFLDSYQYILNDVIQWSGVIKPFGFYNSRDVSNHYIEVDFYLTPLKSQYLKEEPRKQLIANLISEKSSNIILFGKPGMGKTTSMKMVVQKILLDENFLKNHFQIPFVVRLRELKDKFSQKELENNTHFLIFLYLFRQFNLTYKVIDNEIEDNFKDVTIGANIVIRILNELGVVLILDGFDEIEREFRDKIVSQIKQIALSAPRCKIILTTRTGEFNYALDTFTYHEIAPLSKAQIEEFASKWLPTDAKNNFLTNLYKSPFADTAMKPLILSFLCTIYQYNGELPNKPKFVYQEIIDLLISKWDRERGFGRMSKFSGFNKIQKLDFMSQLAFYLVEKSKFNFSKYDVQVAYSEISYKYQLPKDGYQEVIEEIEEHSGLFIQSGVNSYEFPHKSLQEFLASEYLVKYSPLSDYNLVDIPHELAIVVSLASNPNKKLIEILDIVGRYQYENLDAFLSTFITRLESEEPIFERNFTTAIDILKIINLPNLDINKMYDYTLRIYNLDGIALCFKELESQCSSLPEIVKGLMKGEKFYEKQVVEIKPDSQYFKGKLSTYYKFLENWTYISPYKGR